MAADGKVPVFESVGAATRTFSQHWRFSLIAGAAAAAASTALTLMSASLPMIALVFSIAGTLVHAYLYAGQLGASLNGPQTVLSRLGADGGRVWSAMAIIGFLLMIISLIYAIVASIVIFSGAPEVMNEFGANSEDPAAAMQALGRLWEEQGGLLVGVGLAFFAIWMLLTSRLYLAAPASYEAQRILTFETWTWTKGNMLRILAARLLLLLPVYLLLSVITGSIGVAVGINPMDIASMTSAAASNAAGYAAYLFVGQLLTFGVYFGLEAALSAYLYRGLKPADASV
jgi:hypothetical protein